MTNCNKNTNPLHHNGTSQAQRLLPGMDKNKFALVDEKDYSDWIVFASEIAAYINYYDSTNNVSGNWQVFFSSDISARLGIIAIQDIDRYRIEIKERLDFIRDDNHQSSIITVKIKLNELFSAVLTLCKALDEIQLKLPVETTLKSTLLNLIKTKLAPALKKLIAYHAAANDSLHEYLNHSFLSTWKILNKPLTDATVIISTDGLSDNWLFETDKTNWNDYVNSIEKDDSVFNNPLTGVSNDYLSIEHAANHNLFIGIFDICLTSYTSIKKEAESELLKAFESYDAHTAHYALFLSFLKLFRFAQNHGNTITQRHLDFYYREVLKFQPRPALANHVHVLGEVAKQVDDYLLAAGTILKAGKDSLNNDVVYTLDSDTVLNKARIAQLKTYFKYNAGDKAHEPGTTKVMQNNEGRVFASPVANSDDGRGAELTSKYKEWHPYVHKVYADDAFQSFAMPKVQLGFALASHYLYLTEGERKVYIRLVTNPSAFLDGKKIECWLTTEKEWYKVNTPVVNSQDKKLSDKLTACTEISFTIPGSDPAIVNYNAAVHGGLFNCALPVLKVYLINEDTSVYEYDAIKDLIVTQVEIRVEVGMEDNYNQKGLKNLLISNDFGALDVSKPFLPFGSQPRKDAGIVIGHKEIFSKKNASVKLNIEWADLPGDFKDINYNSNYSSSIDSTTGLYSYFKNSDVTPYYPNVLPYFLQSGFWDNHIGNPASEIPEKEIFNMTASKVQVSFTDLLIPENAVFDSSKNDEYLFNAASVNGFLKLGLNGDFGHSNYLKDLSTYLVEKSKSDHYDKAVGVEPTEPYTPKIKSLYASYSAYTVNGIADISTYTTREIRFFHLYPFGEGEQHKYLNPTGDVFLLPQFKHTRSGNPTSHCGEFYIGIENLEPGQAVSILFQVMEGTTDPKLVKPPEHLHWAYLVNNQWVEFESNEYSDSTQDLVQSGIIAFAIPKTATANNTILPAGYVWLRAAISEAAEAVCKLLSVDAQAAVATFSDNKNAEDFLNSPLAAGTISRLKTPDAAVKKISQPYSSFGGRQNESSDHFYFRVSERLRHKSRAITIWDYEHMVLEAFPEIYKVKCLNHTQIEDGFYNEVKPGHVSIITIPTLQNSNDADPLKPYTQQSVLTNIKNYLKKKISCFVNLHVRQPQFEEIKMEFSLKLYDQFKDFNFYSVKLQEEITQLLSPWAYGNPSSIDFGGKVNKSVLINFIEERYYVDYITDVYMYVKINDLTEESSDRDEILASTARSILVSVSAPKHIIHPLTKNGESIPAQCLDS